MMMIIIINCKLFGHHKLGSSVSQMLYDKLQSVLSPLEGPMLNIVVDYSAVVG